ncbi:MAG TPA: hypothetical protein IAA52_10985 [Candidatus Pullichristensenella stercorigallinarum]|uniref:PsbP C-terminal domain-containing protein n=1 Tax=Candidatus Pullichristensenella stercorigallinarum TaxID=2840909 RepID=A0A9D0ZQ74_9FIRM|nr:hypothetical protein [Candidatus Pullichristensenella stercorigallinarum]
MKKTLALFLTLAMFGSAAFAETDPVTRQRDITVEGVTETINETLYTSASGYTIWLPDGWTLQDAAAADPATDETATDETTADTAGDAVTDTATEDAATGTATDDATSADATTDTATDAAASDDAATGDATADDAAATDAAAAADDATATDDGTQFAADVYVPADNADVSLTVQPSTTLTADDAEASLQEASYTEDADATVGEIESFTMDSGVSASTVEVISGGVVYRYYFIAGDSLTLCVTAQFPEEATEGYGARMEEMVAGIEFATW